MYVPSSLCPTLPCLALPCLNSFLQVRFQLYSFYNKNREYRGSVAGAIAAIAADSGSEDFYTENDRLGRPRVSSVNLMLSSSAQHKRQHLRQSQESFVKDSMETSGVLRLSLPNGGWGRRSIESFDEPDGGDYSYGPFRGIEDDSAPMMASLSLPNFIMDSNQEDRDSDRDKHTGSGEKDKEKEKEKDKEVRKALEAVDDSFLSSMTNPSHHHKERQRTAAENSLSSAVDQRASPSLLRSESESSGPEMGMKSKYAVFMESVNATKTAKKIPFGSEDSMGSIQSPGAKSFHDAAKAGEKTSVADRGEGKTSKGSPRVSTRTEVRSFDDYSGDEEDDVDDEDEDEDDVRTTNTGTLSGLGPNAGGPRNRDSADYGTTVSTLGGSGPVIPRGGRDAGYLGGKAEAKGMDRFDFDRTVDSEGDMLKGRDVPLSQVRECFLLLLLDVFFIFIYCLLSVRCRLFSISCQLLELTLHLRKIISLVLMTYSYSFHLHFLCALVSSAH